MYLSDYISGERFVGLGDFVYMPSGKKDANPLFNTFHVSELRETNIVYTHTLYVKEFFEVIKHLPNKFIVVTHNCDENVDSSYIIPDNVIKWYSQNVNVVDSRLESIPIGLENSKWTRVIHKPEIMIAKLQTPKKMHNLVYMNHNIKTNPAERQKPYKLLEGKPWVTSVHGVNFSHFDSYLDNVYNHKFVICPMGNGIDTHRTWEALYMGTIPIEKRNINNQFYKDLPICFVDSWEEVTYDFLLKELERIEDTVWNKDKLGFEYWRTKIKESVY